MSKVTIRQRQQDPTTVEVLIDDRFHAFYTTQNLLALQAAIDAYLSPATIDADNRHSIWEAATRVACSNNRQITDCVEDALTAWRKLHGY